MTSDYYPLASPRGKRSIQQINESVSLSDENGHSAVACAVTKGILYFNEKLFSLRAISSNNLALGYWLFKGNEPVCCDSETPLNLEKCACYDKNNVTFRDCFNMGSYICTFPDGVIYETENTETSAPVYKVEEVNPAQSVTIRTVRKSVSGDRYVSFELGSEYRIQDGQIQHYIDEEALWVNQITYVIIFVKNQIGTFSSFREGDTVSIKHGEIVQEVNDPYNRPVCRSGIFDRQKDEASLKIIKKGRLNTGSFGVEDSTDYIVAEGHMEIFNSYQGSDNGSSSISGTFSNTVIKRKCPDIKLACECQNRIWACSKDGHEIYASALGDPYNFYNYSGLTTDSYAVNVGTYGAFTGCVNFLGRPHFFKENALHIINGSYPSNAGETDGLSFSVSSLTDFKGVEKGSERSLAIIDNILYYKSSSGIIAFDGASTVVISDALGKEKYKNAVAGAYKNKYYVSMQDKSGNYHLFVYDTELGLWSREDNGHINKFINAGSELLFLNADDNKIYSVSDENVLNNTEYEKEKNFEWMCETGNFGYSYPNNKYLSRFQLRLRIENGAAAAFFIQYDSDGVWHRRGEMSGNGIKTFLIPVVPIRCDHMKIRITGKGDVKLISLSRIFEEGGDI